MEGSQLWSEAVSLMRRLLGEASWSGLVQQWMMVGLEALPMVVQAALAAEGENWVALRPQLCQTLASLSVLGGLAEELRRLDPDLLYGRVITEGHDLLLAASEQDAS